MADSDGSLNKVLCVGLIIFRPIADWLQGRLKKLVVALLVMIQS